MLGLGLGLGLGFHSYFFIFRCIMLYIDVLYYCNIFNIVCCNQLSINKEKDNENIAKIIINPKFEN